MTTCINCDAQIPDTVQHYRINERPWCAHCARPYRGGATTSIVTTLKVLLFGGGSVVMFFALWRMLPMGLSFIPSAIITGAVMAFVGRVVLFPPRTEVDVTTVPPLVRRR